MNTITTHEEQEKRIFKGDEILKLTPSSIGKVIGSGITKYISTFVIRTDDDNAPLVNLNTGILWNGLDGLIVELVTYPITLTPNN